MKKSSSSFLDDNADIVVGCQLHTKNEKKLTRVRFYVKNTFATSFLRILRLKGYVPEDDAYAVKIKKKVAKKRKRLHTSNPTHVLFLCNSSFHHMGFIT
jgi:hypothetical protein